MWQYQQPTHGERRNRLRVVTVNSIYRICTQVNFPIGSQSKFSNNYQYPIQEEQNALGVKTDKEKNREKRKKGKNRQFPKEKEQG